MSVKTLSVMLSLMILMLIIELVRREKLTFKYAVAWILVSLIAVCLAVFDNFLYAMSRLLGFQVTSNFIFFAVLCSFVFLSLLLTIFLCQQNSRNDKIAQKLGLLEQELERLKKDGR